MNHSNYLPAALDDVQDLKKVRTPTLRVAILTPANPITDSEGTAVAQRRVKPRRLDFQGIIDYAREEEARYLTPMIPPGVQVRPSPLHGNGLFCVKPLLAKGTIVTMYPNSIVLRLTPHELITSVTHPYALHLRGNVFLDAIADDVSNESSLGHIINTSRPALAPPYNKPNARMLDMGDGSTRVYIELIRDVEYLDEILCDYHWHITSDTLRCVCSRCRD